MKKSPFASILLFALFYTTLLSTMVVIPLVLASHYTARMATVHREAPVWERFLDAPSKVDPRRESHLPQSIESVPGPVAKQGPIDKSVPDAAMIRPGKLRAKTIRV